MSEVIGVFSAKGGVGKTTTAINLSAALHEFGRLVLLVDTDLPSPNLSIYLGCHDLSNSLNQVVKGNCSMTDAIYKHGSGINIVVGSIKSTDVETIDYGAINENIDAIKGSFEYVITDSAPGQNEMTLNQLSSVDSFVIVTTPEMVSVVDALRTITFANKIGKKILGVVITRSKGLDAEMREENIRAMLGVPILGVVPEDEAVVHSANVGSSVVYAYPDSESANAYKKIAANIMGQNYNRV